MYARTCKNGNLVLCLWHPGTASPANSLHRHIVQFVPLSDHPHLTWTCRPTEHSSSEEKPTLVNPLMPLLSSSTQTERSSPVYQQRPKTHGPRCLPRVTSIAWRFYPHDLTSAD